MKLIDFFIGFFLMNAMPHFILSVWKGRILSAFGFGNKQNLAYSLLNFGLALGLFFYAYGWNGFSENGIFIGCLIILLIYYATGHFFYRTFNKKAAS